MTVDELLEIVLRDAAFYAESGGGVTLSGGEPTSQFAFAVALLKACKRAGIHTAIETSGFVGRDRLSRLLEWLDDVYYDLKVISPEQHRVFTGVDNAPILSNARWLSRSGAKVTFRVPLVPGMTMTEPNVAAMVSFIAALRVRQIDLCPYQSGWRRKLERVGPIQDSLAIAPPSSEQVQAVVAAFGAAGIEVRMSGDSS